MVGVIKQAVETVTILQKKIREMTEELHARHEAMKRLQSQLDQSREITRRADKQACALQENLFEVKKVVDEIIEGFSIIQPETFNLWAYGKLEGIGFRFK